MVKRVSVFTPLSREYPERRMMFFKTPATLSPDFLSVT